MLENETVPSFADPFKSLSFFHASSIETSLSLSRGEINQNRVYPRISHFGDFIEFRLRLEQRKSILKDS